MKAGLAQGVQVTVKTKSVKAMNHRNNILFWVGSLTKNNWWNLWISEKSYEIYESQKKGMKSMKIYEKICKNYEMCKIWCPFDVEAEAWTPFDGNVWWECRVTFYSKFHLINYFLNHDLKPWNMFGTQTVHDIEGEVEPWWCWFLRVILWASTRWEVSSACTLDWTNPLSCHSYPSQ